MEYRLWLVFVIGFLATLFLTKLWIKVATKEKIVVMDANKYNKPKIPSSGGIAVILGFILAIMFYIGISVFAFNRTVNLVEIFAMLTTILIISFIGFVDDFIGGWKKGIKQWQKPLLTIPAVLPLMAIKAGQSIIYLPFVGVLDLGLIYPLVLIPIAIIGASQGFNMLAGLNGLTASLGSTILFALAIIAYITGQPWLALITATMVACLLGFLIFNNYPSRVFEGDVLRYPLGAMIAIVAILGNMEKAALILFIPFIIELVIKLKNKLKSECFGIPKKDGTFEYPKRIGSLTHVVMRFLNKIHLRMTERSVVLTLLIFELILILIVILTL